MYAVIATGGKQYKVAKGDVIEIERLEGKKGDKLIFDKVLFLGGKSQKIGRPYLEDITVDGKIKEQFRGNKLIVYKKKKRRGYEVRRGHRQNLTKVEITAINAK